MYSGWPLQRPAVNPRLSLPGAATYRNPAVTPPSIEKFWPVTGAPGVAVYNAALPDPGEILETTVGRLRTAYDVDVLGGVVAAQVAAPVLRAAGTGTLLFTSGGFADHPVPTLASLSMGKAALRSAATLIAAGVRELRARCRLRANRRTIWQSVGSLSAGALLGAPHSLPTPRCTREPVVGLPSDGYVSDAIVGASV